MKQDFSIDEIEAMAKQLVQKALKRSAELNCLNPGEENYAFATGYLESAIVLIASQSKKSAQELQHQAKNWN